MTLDETPTEDLAANIERLLRVDESTSLLATLNASRFLMERPEWTLDEAELLLATIGHEWPVSVHGDSVEEKVALFALAGCRDSRLLPAIVGAGRRARTGRGRVALVRGTLRIAQGGSRDAAGVALSLALDFATSGGFELWENDDPFSCLHRDPVFPDIVVPYLREFVRFPAMMPVVISTWVAYRSAGLAEGELVDAAALSKLAASSTDEEWTALAASIVELRRDQAGRELRNVSDVCGLHDQVLNGGFAQFFWNRGARRAGSASVGLRLLGLSAAGAVLKEARKRFESSTAEFAQSFGTCDLEAWSVWCSDELFDDLDDVWGAADEERPVLGAVAEYVRHNLSAVVSLVNAG